MKSRISLYIPCYNVECYIARVIEGVLNQSRPPDEIVIVDDGSSDRTLDVVARYPVEVIKHSLNKGLAAACNTGVRQSRYELVASLSADVVPQTDWLEKLAASLEDSSIAMAGGRLQEGMLVSVADRWRQSHMPQHWGDSPLRNPPHVCGNNLILRKSVFDEVGGYNEEYRRAGEDLDISQKVRARGYSTFYEPGAVVTHIRQDSIPSVMATLWRWRNFGNRGLSLRSFLGRTLRLHLGSNFIGLLERDIRAKEYSLLWVDALSLFYMPYFDLCLYFGKTGAYKTTTQKIPSAKRCAESD